MPANLRSCPPLVTQPGILFPSRIELTPSHAALRNVKIFFGWGIIMHKSGMPLGCPVRILSGPRCPRYRQELELD